MYLHTFKDKTLPDQWLLLIDGQVSSVNFTFCQPHLQYRWDGTPSLAGHTPKPAPSLWCPLLLAGPHLPKPCLTLVTSLPTLSWHLLTSLCFLLYFIHFSFCINSPVSFSHLNSIFQISDLLPMMNHIYIFFSLRESWSLSGFPGFASGYSVLEPI